MGIDVNHLIGIIEKTAPPHFVAGWDRSGVQIASAVTRISTLALCLDPLPAQILAARELGAHFLLCHHPLSLTPRLPDRCDAFHAALRLCLEQEIWLYAAHTSLDANPHGPARWQGHDQELEDLRVLAVEDPLEVVAVHCLGNRSAELEDFLSGNADLLYFSPLGPDRALLGISAAAWPPLRAEMLSSFGFDGRLVALRQEQPQPGHGFGGVGNLPQPLSGAAFLERLGSLIGPVDIRRIGDLPQTVRRIAFCPGSGMSLLSAAAKAGADVYITGDAKYHQALDALPGPPCVLDVGHFALEERMMRVWSGELSRLLSPQGVHVHFLSGMSPFTHVSLRPPRPGC